MDDDYIWLDQPLHKNKFPKIDLEAINFIILSFDGSIMSVKESVVKEFYNKNEVPLIRAGYKEMPKIGNIETEEELSNALSYFITI
tara:strand:+ start:2524 stop:2781 length:258 start_codon:yes stop_codon:yes gene_type:complete